MGIYAGFPFSQGFFSPFSPHFVVGPLPGDEPSFKVCVSIIEVPIAKVFPSPPKKVIEEAAPPLLLHRKFQLSLLDVPRDLLPLVFSLFE